MFKIIFILSVLVSASYAKSYSIFLASSKYLDVAKKYYEDVKFHTPNFYDVVIRIHEKQNYSVIIRRIENIKKAKSIQKLFFVQNKYKDSYIKAFEIEPSYKTVKLEKESIKKTALKEDKKFKQEVENSNDYITASTFFNTKQYEKSYHLFYKLFLKHNYNKNINYFLAKSAYHTKRYDAATAAYERVLNLDSNFNQARYDYARILYKLKQNQEAKKEFNTLLESNIKEETKEKIKEFLNVLDSQNKKRSITANIAIGFSRSSNVNNGLISPEYSLPGLNDIVVTGEKPIADSSIFEAVNINFFKYFKEQPIRVKNSFLVYNKNHFEAEDEDLAAISYKPSLSYFNKNLNQVYTLQLTADRIFKNTNEDFYSFAISPKIATKNFRGHLKYQRIMYTHEENEEKDFEKMELYAKVNLFKNMNFYTKLYKNMKIKDLRTDIDKYTIRNGLNFFYNITPKDKINLKYQFDYSKYDDENIGFNTIRRDRKHTVELSLKHGITKSDFIHTSTSFIKNYSNQDAYVYDEKEFKLSYLKTFLW